jgi:adenylate kinase
VQDTPQSVPYRSNGSFPELLLSQRSPNLSGAFVAYLQQKHAISINQDQLRERSAQEVKPEDVEAVDRQLLEFVNSNRGQSHIVTDSHAVTKETFGYRVTPFTLPQLEALRPTMICVLYADPTEVISQITENSQGRP